MLLGGWEVELELMGEEEGGIMVRIRVQWRAQAVITATKGKGGRRETEREGERGREEKGREERGRRGGRERKKEKENERVEGKKDNRTLKWKDNYVKIHIQRLMCQSSSLDSAIVTQDNSPTITSQTMEHS